MNTWVLTHMGAPSLCSGGLLWACMIAPLANPGSPRGEVEVRVWRGLQANQQFQATDDNIRSQVSRLAVDADASEWNTSAVTTMSERA